MLFKIKNRPSKKWSSTFFSMNQNASKNFFHTKKGIKVKKMNRIKQSY